MTLERSEHIGFPGRQPLANLFQEQPSPVLPSTSLHSCRVHDVKLAFSLLLCDSEDEAQVCVLSSSRFSSSFRRLLMFPAKHP